MTHYQNLRVEARDVVLWIRIDRPASRNALSRPTLAEIARACNGIAAEPSLKAVVITGEGPEAFAAGGDLKELASVRTADQVGALFDEASTALDAVRRCPVPVLAGLNGLALGGGAELAVACDFRVAARHATIGCVQARLHISSGFGGGSDLVRLLGPGRALRHALTGEALSAAAARDLGLVDEVAGDDETLEQCVGRFLAPILRQSPRVIRAWKAMAIADRLGLPLAARRHAERDGFCRTWVHDDHWVQVEKFMQKSREKAQ